MTPLDVLAEFAEDHRPDRCWHCQRIAEIPVDHGQMCPRVAAGLVVAQVTAALDAARAKASAEEILSRLTS